MTKKQTKEIGINYSQVVILIDFKNSDFINYAKVYATQFHISFILSALSDQIPLTRSNHTY